MEPIFVTILGKRYRLIFTGRMLKQAHGSCDSPKQKGKEIRIKRGLSEKRTLEVVIHEALHAADWHKDEEWVEGVADDIARILWRLGYRRQDMEDGSA